MGHLDMFIFQKGPEQFIWFTVPFALHSLYVYCTAYYSLYVYCTDYYSLYVYCTAYYSLYVYCTAYYSLYVYCTAYYSLYVYCTAYYSLVKFDPALEIYRSLKCDATCLVCYPALPEKMYFHKSKPNQH